MQVGKHAVVTIDYTLKDPQGTVIDSSTAAGREPLPYLHGAGALIPGLEKALEGKSKGDKLQVTVLPEEGYGARDENLVQTVNRSAFQGMDVKPGMQFRTQGQEGAVAVVTVTKVEGEQVTVDGNHQLAGIPLSFDVTIKDVRAATKEEIAHGHVHGPGGHHHHH
jgi:FKBP-type peptidyl-prolyl cis-trans isomerase SlyD